MPLSLSDVLKKAADKGVGSKSTIKQEILKPWQDESLLHRDNEVENIKKSAAIKRDKDKNTEANVELQVSIGAEIVNTDISPHYLESYMGWQKELVLFLYASSLESNESYITEKISVNDIKNALDQTTFSLNDIQHKISIGMVKSTISRLKVKGVIEVYQKKNGRGGWCKYKINELLFSDISKNNPSKMDKNNVTN